MSLPMRHSKQRSQMITTTLLLVLCSMLMLLPSSTNAAANAASGGGYTNNGNFNAAKANAKSQFITAMRAAKDKPNYKLHRQDKQKRFTEMILKKATLLPPKDSTEEDPVVEYAAFLEEVVRRHEVRRLDEAAEGDDAADGDDAAVEGDDAYAEEDDAAAADEEEEEEVEEDDAVANNDDQRDDDVYLNYGFDLSEYSLKYATCSSIATFSDDMAADADTMTVLETDQFVVFRLCPSNSCSSSSIYGCTGDYGEYMLTMEDWLEIIAEYREEEFERYCDYCGECDDGNYYGGDDIYNNNQDDGGRRLADQVDDGAYQDEDYQEDQYADGYCSLCTGYYDMCNAEDAIDYSNFFGCKKYQVSDDLILYIGPHCASDKSAIVLTLFDDEYCTNYVGDSYDINTITGLDITKETLMQYYNNDCIACKESDLMFQDADEDGNDNEITGVCENLYAASGKCNKYMYSANQQSYQSSAQANNENTVCNYISSVVTGNYDEKGYIYFDAGDYSSNNKYNEFANDLYRVEIVTGGQVMGLLIFSTAVLAFMIWSCVLHNKISKKSMDGLASGTQYRNNPGSVGRGATKELPRQNSGIMMCRSEVTANSALDIPAKYRGGTMA